MKTKIGHYYIFFTVEEFNEKVSYWKSKGRIWIDGHDPVINSKKLPCVLNVDNRTMMHGVITKKYFEMKKFTEMYRMALREHTLKNILN